MDRKKTAVTREVGLVLGSPVVDFLGLDIQTNQNMSRCAGGNELGFRV
jgi:hypothetical protein